MGLHRNGPGIGVMDKMGSYFLRGHLGSVSLKLELERKVYSYSWVLGHASSSFSWEDPVYPELESLLWDVRTQCVHVVLFAEPEESVFFATSERQTMRYAGARGSQSLGTFSASGSRTQD